MAEEISIVIRAKDEASRVLKTLPPQLKEIESAGGSAGSGLAKLGAESKRTADHATITSTALHGLGKAISAVALAAAAAAGAGLTAATLSAAAFSKTMSGVGAVSNATGAEMQRLSGLALQLGKDTVFSATDAAKGIEELIKGGASIADIMNGAAAATLSLATAGGVDLTTAANVATGALNVFGLAGKDMAHVTNLVAGAANASSIGVADFQMSMSQAGAVAQLSGQTFDSLAETIAVLGKGFLKNSDAGTSIKSMLLQLQPTTKEAKDAFKQLGLMTAEGGNAFFDASGKAKSMGEIAGLLQQAMSGLTAEGRLMALELMFGTDGMRAAGLMAKAGSKGFDEMRGSMSKVTAEAVALKRLDNLAGDMGQLGGSVETAATQFGMLLEPNLRRTAQALRGVVDASGPIATAVGTTLAKAIDSMNNLSAIAQYNLEQFRKKGVEGLARAIETEVPGLYAYAKGVWEIGSQALGAFFGLSQLRTMMHAITGDAAKGITGPLSPSQVQDFRNIPLELKLKETAAARNAAVQGLEELQQHADASAIATAGVAAAAAGAIGPVRNFASAAKEAKTALEELGISAGTFRKAAEMAAFGAAQIKSMLITLGVAAIDAGEEIEGIGLTAEKLTLAFRRAGLSADAAAAAVARVQAEVAKKAAWDALGVSLSTVRQAMDLLKFSADEQSAILIALGESTMKAGPLLDGLGVTIEQLAAAFDRAGKNGAVLAEQVAATIAATKAAVEAEKAAIKAKQEAEEATRAYQKALDDLASAQREQTTEAQRTQDRMAGLAQTIMGTVKPAFEALFATIKGGAGAGLASGLAAALTAGVTAGSSGAAAADAFAIPGVTEPRVRRVMSVPSAAEIAAAEAAAKAAKDAADAAKAGNQAVEDQAAVLRGRLADGWKIVGGIIGDTVGAILKISTGVRELETASAAVSGLNAGVGLAAALVTAKANATDAFGAINNSLDQLGRNLGNLDEPTRKATEALIAGARRLLVEFQAGNISARQYADAMAVLSGPLQDVARDADAAAQKVKALAEAHANAVATVLEKQAAEGAANMGTALAEVAKGEWIASLKEALRKALLEGSDPSAILAQLDKIGADDRTKAAADRIANSAAAAVAKMAEAGRVGGAEVQSALEEAAQGEWAKHLQEALVAAIKAGADTTAITEDLTRLGNDKRFHDKQVAVAKNDAAEAIKEAQAITSSWQTNLAAAQSAANADVLRQWEAGISAAQQAAEGLSLTLASDAMWRRAGAMERDQTARNAIAGALRPLPTGPQYDTQGNVIDPDFLAKGRRDTLDRYMNVNVALNVDGAQLGTASTAPLMRQSSSLRRVQG